ncbi:MAG: hypothetical protein ACT4O1_05985 [Gemmatimonadota bacterium]
MNRFTRVAAVVLTLFSAACSDEPVTPHATGRQFSTAQGGDLSKVARYTSGAPDVLFGFASKSIGPAGGSIRLLDFEVIVPAKAVAKATNFTIRLPADPFGAEYAYAEFGPHGLRFATPVTIRLPYQGTTSEGGTPHVMWNNSGQWVAFPTSATEDGRIQAQTNHFSEYGTEETDPSRGITLAGKRLR